METKAITPPFWKINSLKIRVLLSTLVMTIVMLPVIGFTLTQAFERQLSIAMKNELTAYSYSILTVAEVDERQLLMPEYLLENQFNISQSGLYALIYSLPKQNFRAEKLWQSQSLLTLPIQALSAEFIPSPKVGESAFSSIMLEGRKHLLYSFSVSFSDNAQPFPITLHLIKDQKELLLALNDFKQQLWSWLIALMLVFIVIQVAWLLWTLKPLKVLAHELANIEQGKKNALNAHYPLELQQVTSQLNTLLLTEQNQRKRYRNALSDLAHSLKNPLAIMQSEANLSKDARQQISLINNIIEHQLKRAQSAGESSWHLGVSVKPVLDKLIASLMKIYQEKQLRFTVNIDKSALFKGDEADLMEMLGNVVDNACKAAKFAVTVTVKGNDKQLTITVEDDGVGIEASKQQAILARGTRADTYHAGHGIGLAIVRDLVSSYQGQLAISTSTLLGGAAFILTF
ncbi:ATP-binding protein [Candidatus Colwellia aromaticivorans]|uniref:ATP-binding protein n=1 Tax=Candidatus Colwellia aromaticivorans TaxID=2267621 RepID=UPI000DF3C34C|nr:ATP-binding protein [Candidatus Colwellia aromaticivorans]